MTVEPSSSSADPGEPPKSASGLPTRSSLIARLKDPADEESWQTFADTYRRLIFAVALRSGLSEAEAQEVVQETMVSVARKMPEFKRVHRRGTFKRWLLNLTRWRIIDQVRKRSLVDAGFPVASTGRPSFDAEGTARTATIERIPDPRGPELAAIWEAESEKHLMDAAMERLKSRVDPELLQLFDCYVVRGWSASKVAKQIGVGLSRVYFAKYKVSKLLKREIQILKEALS